MKSVWLIVLFCISLQAGAGLLLNTQTLLTEGVYSAPFLSDDSGRNGSGLRLEAMGQLTASDAPAVSVWRVQNTNEHPVNVTLLAYASHWQRTLEVPAQSQVLIASGALGLTHALIFQGTEIDVKAARTRPVSSDAALF